MLGTCEHTGTLPTRFLHVMHAKQSRGTHHNVCWGVDLDVVRGVSDHLRRELLPRDDPAQPRSHKASKRHLAGLCAAVVRTKVSTLSSTCPAAHFFRPQTRVRSCAAALSAQHPCVRLLIRPTRRTTCLNGGTGLGETEDQSWKHWEATRHTTCKLQTDDGGCSERGASGGVRAQPGPNHPADHCGRHQQHPHQHWRRPFGENHCFRQPCAARHRQRHSGADIVFDMPKGGGRLEGEGEWRAHALVPSGGA